MILADTDVLSALAKVGHLLLFTLFRTNKIRIAPGVFRELAHSLNLRRQYAEDVLALVPAGQIEVISLTQEAATFCDTLRTLAQLTFLPCCLGENGMTELAG